MTRSAYSPRLLDHYKRPRNFGALDAPDAAYEDVNPLCGDRIRMEVRVGGGVVEEVRFRGDACAICTASASVLTEMATGRPASAALALEVGAVTDALEAEVEPGRVQCVKLALDVLRGALGLVGRGPLGPEDVR